MRLHLESSATASQDVRGTAATGTGSSSDARSANATGLRDSISISTTSAALGQIAAERAARMEQISTAIRSGTYQIPSASISAAIVSQAGA